MLITMLPYVPEAVPELRLPGSGGVLAAFYGHSTRGLEQAVHGQNGQLWWSALLVTTHGIRDGLWDRDVDSREIPFPRFLESERTVHVLYICSVLLRLRSVRSGPLDIRLWRVRGSAYTCVHACARTQTCIRDQHTAPSLRERRTAVRATPGIAG